MVAPLSLNERIFSKLFCWKTSSPTAKTSSMRTMSGWKKMTVEKASRRNIPEE